MATYAVNITQTAEKSLAALPKDIQRAAGTKIASLAANPRPHNSKPLKGMSNTWAIRVTRRYRILYEIDDTKLVVLVVEVDHRKDVYR